MSSRLIHSHRVAFGRIQFTHIKSNFRCYSTDSDQSMLSEISEKYLGARKVDFTERLQFLDSSTSNAIPIFRVTDKSGRLIDEALDPKIPDHIMIKMYRDMIALNIADRILYESQRQGRISFYMTNFGEEATQIGSAAAWQNSDLVFAQYRETGVLLYRGFTLQNLMDQCYSNRDDLGKGKQMPVHFGSKELNFVTISSPLGTQLPQAVGAAYAYKRANRPDVVVCYFGEGTTSEGDAHAAFNFAATLRCPVVFVCRNNGYAISTPASEQYVGDGVAGRAFSYGLRVTRVDGNDLLAVHSASLEARRLALEGKPTLIEAMTYRVGHHSTSDDSSAYRTANEVNFWQKMSNPIDRFKLNLIQRGLWSETQDSQLKTETRQAVLDSFSKAERKKKPNVDEMFNDVYLEMTPRLKEQMNEFKAHVQKYGQHYPLSSYES